MVSHWEKVLRRIDDYRWEIPRDYKDGMRVPGIVYASEAVIGKIMGDQSLEQVANVAFLPGIVYASLAMPDIHWGYGFPVGGVAATRVDDGVISPGGVGFDINCGVRLLRTDLVEADVKPRLEKLVETLYRDVPTGVGSKKTIPASRGIDLDEVMIRGARWAVDNGFGDPEDILVTEEGGAIEGADPSVVSQRARERGTPQLGTLWLRQPLPRGAGGRRDFQPGGGACTGNRPSGSDHHNDALRLPWIWTPDMYRLSQDGGSGGKAIRNCPSRSATRLRARQLSRRQELLGCHAVRGELRLGQPPVHYPLDKGVFPGGIRTRLEGDGHLAGVRRGP